MKEKITTGANDRSKHDTIAQTGKGLPDDSSSIVEVDKEGTAKLRDGGQKRPSQPSPPPTGPAVDDEDPDYSPMDTSPARNKDRARDTPVGEAGPNDDTYD